MFAFVNYASVFFIICFLFMEDKIAYCYKKKRCFFIPINTSGIIKCPHCGGYVFNHMGNLYHTIQIHK